MTGLQTGRSAKEFEARFLAVYEGNESELPALRLRLEGLGAIVHDGQMVRKGMRTPRLEADIPQEKGVSQIPPSWPSPVVRLLEFSFPTPTAYDPRAVVRRPTGEIVGPFGTRGHSDGTRTLIVLGEPQTIILLRNLHSGAGHFVNVVGTPLGCRLRRGSRRTTIAKQLQFQTDGRLVSWMDRPQSQCLPRRAMILGFHCGILFCYSIFALKSKPSLRD